MNRQFLHSSQYQLDLRNEPFPEDPNIEVECCRQIVRVHDCMNDTIDEAQNHSMTTSRAKLHVAVGDEQHSEVVVAMQERNLICFLPQDEEDLKGLEVSNVLQGLT